VLDYEKKGEAGEQVSHLNDCQGEIDGIPGDGDFTVIVGEGEAVITYIKTHCPDEPGING